MPVSSLATAGLLRDRPERKYAAVAASGTTGSTLTYIALRYRADSTRWAPCLSSAGGRYHGTTIGKAVLVHGAIGVLSRPSSLSVVAARTQPLALLRRPHVLRTATIVAVAIPTRFRAELP